MLTLPRLCCLLLLTASASASAGNLYKWKDANGVTQYSERPPAGKQYETRRITDSGASVAETTAPAEAAESSQCVAARRNLELLNGSGPVMHDTDGDGKPDAALDDTQRSAQKRLAEAAAAAYCKAGPKT